MILTMNMDSLWIEYYSLIISTIFYLLYLKFANFSKKAKEASEEQEDDTKINHSEDENKKKDNKHQQTKPNSTNSELSLSESQEINPNIDEMISSLNNKLKSISNPYNHHKPNLYHLTNHDHNNNHQQSLHHKHHHLNNINTQSQSTRHNHDHNDDHESLSHLHPNEQLTDSEYETDNSSIMTSPRSTLNNISPKHKIKAMPILSEAYNEIFQFTLSNSSKDDAKGNNDSYYDTAEFDDETEYDTDDVNNYDKFNKQLRNDVNYTLYKIADNHCMTPPSTSLFKSYGSLSKTCSIGSIGSDDTFHAPSPIKEALSALHTNKEDKDNMTNIGFISSQSTSPYNMHRSQNSGGSTTESGSEFYDKFISENYDEFLLNEEYSSSDRNCIDHHRMESHDSVGSMGDRKRVV